MKLTKTSPQPRTEEPRVFMVRFVEAAVVLVPRHAMLPGVFVNSDGTLREAYVDGAMANL